MRIMCECKVISMTGIEYCPLHKAAPAMYEALLDMTFAYRRGLKVEQARAYNKAIKILAQAEENL